MTDECKEQFNLNIDTIAKFAGLEPNVQVVHVYADGVEESCDLCGQDITTKEMKRNGGVCDRCAAGK